MSAGWGGTVWEEKGKEVSAKRSPVPALAARGAHGTGPEPDSPGSSVSARSPFSTLSSLPVAGAVWSGGGRPRDEAAAAPGGAGGGRGAGGGGRGEGRGAWDGTSALRSGSDRGPGPGLCALAAASAHPRDSARGAGLFALRDRGGREKLAAASGCGAVLST